MRWILMTVALLVVVALIAWQLRDGVVVQTAPVQRGKIEEFVDEQAKTRLPKTYEITMPYAGRIAAITLREGDRVAAGDLLARMVPEDLKDEVAEAQAAVDRLAARIVENDDTSVELSVQRQAELFAESMESTVAAAIARTTASKSRLDFSEVTLGRIRALLESGASTREQLDEAEVNYVESQVSYRQDVLTTEALKAIQAATDLLPTIVGEYMDRKQLTHVVLQREKEEAEARLRRALQRQQRGEMRSPIDGVVLARLVDNEQFQAAGTVLLRLGDLRQLEVAADLLSEDIGRVREGDPAIIYGAALRATPEQGFAGSVSRIYPAGFTKQSSLGVEQQRVTTIVQFAPETLARVSDEQTIGVDYRVRVRIVTDVSESGLLVPRSALFTNSQGRWQVFVVRDGRAVLQDVELGLMNDAVAEVTTGLAESEQVVLAPDSDLQPTSRVQVAPQ